MDPFIIVMIIVSAALVGWTAHKFLKGEDEDE